MCQPSDLASKCNYFSYTVEEIKQGINLVQYFIKRASVKVHCYWHWTQFSLGIKPGLYLANYVNYLLVIGLTYITEHGNTTMADIFFKPMSSGQAWPDHWDRETDAWSLCVIWQKWYIAEENCSPPNQPLRSPNKNYGRCGTTQTFLMILQSDKELFCCHLHIFQLHTNG